VTDPGDIGNLVQGGGLLAFAGAVLLFVRKLETMLERALRLLERLDERTAIEAAEAPPPAPAPSSPRRRVRTDPRGVRIRYAPDTDNESETETDPGGRRGR